MISTIKQITKTAAINFLLINLNRLITAPEMTTSLTENYVQQFRQNKWFEYVNL